VAGVALALPLVGLLVLPVIALVATVTLADLQVGFRHPLFLPALKLSLGTTISSLAIVVLTGIPLSWWLATTSWRGARAVELAVELPIVLPPAVLGIGMLRAFGSRGLFGPELDALGIRLPFTTAAVVVAQVAVSAPFFVQSATAAFRRVDPDLLIVARTLGRSPVGALIGVALPLALPGLLGGAAIAWARALGEFGATLLFAGNRTGATQTMPLAIYTTLETDVRGAVALALVLVAVSALLLSLLRGLPASFGGRPTSPDAPNRARRAGGSRR